MMIDNSGLDNDSDNFEIRKRKGKKIPTENETNDNTGLLSEKQSVLENTDKSTGPEGDNIPEDECLKAERLLKALLAIEVSGSCGDAMNNLTDQTAPNALVPKDGAEEGEQKAKKFKSEESLSSGASIECTTEDRDEHNSSFDSDDLESQDGSDDQELQEQEDYLLNCDDSLLKENLFIEHEKLAKEVAKFEIELNAQLEKCDVLEESLQQLEYDKKYWQDENKGLLEQLAKKESDILDLKEDAKELEAICANLTRKEKERTKESNIQLGSMKSKLLAQEDELKLVKKRHDNEYNELAKNHGTFLGKILGQAREINAILFTALKNSGGGKPEHCKSKNVMEFLKHLTKNATALANRSGQLELKAKQLRTDCETQTKTLNKVCNEKKQLQKEVADIGKQNDELLKQNAKIERERETLKTEVIRTKNMLQTNKVRLDEFKANARLTKRENETALQEKLAIEAALKKHGIDVKILLANDENLCISVKNESPNAVLKESSGSATSEKAGILIDEKLNIHGEAINSELNAIFAGILQNGFCLKRMTNQLPDSTADVDSLVKAMQCSCGCYENEETRQLFAEKLSKLTSPWRWLKMTVYKDDISRKVEEDKILNAYLINAQNICLNDVVDQRERSLEQSKRTIRNYRSRVQDLVERVRSGQANQTKPIISGTEQVIRELQRICMLLEHVTNAGNVEGLILLNAFCIRLKNFIGTSYDPKRGEPFHRQEKPGFLPMDVNARQVGNNELKDRIDEADLIIKDLESKVETKRSEARKVLVKMRETLLKNEQRPAIKSPEQKKSKKAKTNGLFGFMKRKDEQDADAKPAGKNARKSTLLCENQVASHLDLVHCKEQLNDGIQRSLKLEKQLERFGEGMGAFAELLQENFRKSRRKLQDQPHFMWYGEKERELLTNECTFKELVHTRLLRKQIMTLESGIATGTRSLEEYEKVMKGYTPSLMFSTFANLLSKATEERDMNEDNENPEEAHQEDRH